jgi:hemolysin III
MGNQGAVAKTPKDQHAYTFGEELANSITHGLGTGLAIAALVILVAFAVLAHDGYRLASAIVYGITLVLQYAASTLYHALPQPKAKHLFKILDHCGIYLLIAGTYTPFCLVTLRAANGWWLFGVIWGLALVGIVLETFWVYRPRWVSALLFLGMGWLVITSIQPLIENLAATGLWLLIAGGLAYTLGTVFYVLERIHYMHAVWHLWVLVGSVLHFLAVLLYVIQ